MGCNLTGDATHRATVEVQLPGSFLQSESPVPFQHVSRVHPTKSSLSHGVPFRIILQTPFIPPCLRQDARCCVVLRSEDSAGTGGAGNGSAAKRTGGSLQFKRL
jgi:hypothetical protein